MPPRELNVLALLKGEEYYVYIYDDQSRRVLMDSFRNQAADSRLTFNWFDAALLTQRVREQARQVREPWLRSRTLRIEDRG